MLQEDGRLALVLPIEALPEIEKWTVFNRLFISRLCRIKPNPVKPDFRILVELSKLQSALQEENLMIEFEKHHDYTQEYRELTKDFYLKF